MYKIYIAIFPGIEGSCLRINAPPFIGGADYTFRPVLFYMEFVGRMDEVFSNYEQAVLTLFRAVPLVERDDDRAGAICNAENIEHGIFITERAAKACPTLRERDAQKYLWDAFGYDMLAMNRGFYQNFHEVQEVSAEKWLTDQWST